MWRKLALAGIRHNRGAAAVVAVGVFVSALFLSLITSLFYNIWLYDVEQILRTEGGWHGSLTGPLTEADLAALQADPAVQQAVWAQNVPDDAAPTALVTLEERREAYSVMPALAASLGLSQDSCAYHETLLSEYLIYAPGDPEPPLLLPFSILVALVASVSLLMIVRCAFSVSMNACVRQMGCLSSIGATPGQIRRRLLAEAALLCPIPALVGLAAGLGGCVGFMAFAQQVSSTLTGAELTFRYHPGIFIVTLLLIGVTVLFSALLPARRISRMSPLAALRQQADTALGKAKRYPLLALLFGCEGKLAGRALYAQRKALRLSALSLTLSLLAFSMFYCFSALSNISTRHTYFERYQNAWDVMATVEGDLLTDTAVLSAVASIPGVEDAVGYEKTDGAVLLARSDFSGAVLERGGPEALSDGVRPQGADMYQTNMAAILLDDAAFAAYCKTIGINGSQPGAVIVNRVWDQQNSDFRNRVYLPFVQENLSILPLKTENGPISLPVLACTLTPPVLREALDEDGLHVILPVSLRPGPGETETFLRVLTAQDADVDQVEQGVSAALSGYSATVENRVQEKLRNDEMHRGYMTIVSTLCALLSLIGMANVFANAMGFLYQRRREFARYASLGMTPEGMGRVLGVEAFTLAMRPVLLTLPLTVLFTLFAVNASHLDMGEFLQEAPVGPILLYVALLVLLVGLSYWLGGRRLFSSDLGEVLRDDAL